MRWVSIFAVVALATAVLSCAAPSGAFTKHYFVWDVVGGGTSALSTNEALSAAGFVGDMSETLPGLNSLRNYYTVWICLGSYPDRRALASYPVEVLRLSRYLADYDSTCVYMEGDQAWYGDPWTDFHDYFHLSEMGPTSCVADSVCFVDPRFGSDCIKYHSPVFVDGLMTDGVSSSFYVAKPNYPELSVGVMVAYDNGMCTYKTIASSVELGCLGSEYERRELVTRIMDFFCLGSGSVRDVRVVWMPSPPDTVVLGSVQEVAVGAVNDGGTAEQFWLHCTIRDGPAWAYRDSVWISGLSPAGWIYLDLSPWLVTGSERSLELCRYIDLEDDDTTNNRLCGEVLVTGTGVEDAAGRNRPFEFRLGNASPNPFSEMTEISFFLPAESSVELSVVDAAGRLSAILLDGSPVTGQHALTWDGTDRTGSRLPEGVYFLRMKAGPFRAVQKLVLLR